MTVAASTRLEVGRPERAGLRISARLVAGADADEIFIEASAGPVAPAAEAFVALALIPAMVRGWDVRVEGALSPRLLAALPRIQGLFRGWQSWYRIASVETTHNAAPRRRGDGVACFFTGGLDSFYTVLRRRREISELVFVHGFDVALENTDLRARVVRALRRAAAKLDKPLLEVQTNLRAFSDRHVDWAWGYVAGLAAVGHVLAPRFRKIYIPSTHPDSHYSGEDAASGSNPLLPRLWSTEQLELVQEGGEAGRVAKAAFVAEHEVALKTLRVCWWNSAGAYNCGRCPKCLHTMVSLEAVGALERCATFPRQLEPWRIARLRAVTPSARYFWSDNLRALEASGANPDLAAAVRTSLERGADGR